MNNFLIAILVLLLYAFLSQPCGGMLFSRIADRVSNRLFSLFLLFVLITCVVGFFFGALSVAVVLVGIMVVEKIRKI